jgi:hypothetical protein
MRRFTMHFVLISMVLWPLVLTTQEVKPVSKPDFKSIEVKHFTNADSVQLSPSFSKYSYASYPAELQRVNLADQTVEEGAPVNDTQGSHGVFSQFIVLEGRFAAIQEGGEKDGKLEPVFANIEIRYFRRSDHKALPFSGSNCYACTTQVLKLKVRLNGSLQDDEQKVAEAAGVQLADGILMTWQPDKTSKTSKMGWGDMFGW